MRYLATLCFCLFVGCNSSSNSGGGFSGGGIAINGATLRVDLYQEGGVITEIASFTLPFIQGTAGQKIANVIADFNGDGMIADYSVGGPTQEEWIFQNMPIVVTDAELSAFFRLVDVALATAGPIRVRVILTDLDLPATPQLGADGMPSFEGDVTVVVSDLDDNATPTAGAYGGGGTGANSFNNWTNETAGTDRDIDPSIALANGSAFYRPGLPDIPQGINTCVLASIAGSISWLSRAKGFSGKVDDAAKGIDVATPEGVNELTDQLNTLGEMNYTPTNGVLGPAIEPGKNKYVMAKKLPIKTTKIAPADVPADSDIFLVIQEALQDCCTVELALDFPGGGGGHFVQVAGYSDLQFPGGGRSSTTITVHDSNTSTFNDTYNVSGNGDKLGKFPFKKQLREATITFVLIECYDPPLIPAPECVGLDGRVAVPCLVIGGRHYPKYQFVLGNNPMDVCTEPHWHRPSGMVFPLDPPPLTTGGRADPDINECGFGLEADVPQVILRVDLQEFQDFLAANPPLP